MIPIKNLYYMFCYAWSHFPKGPEVETGVDGCPDLPNLFARLLIDHTSRLMRRGLDRGYVGQIEEFRAPRGKLQFSPTIKEQSLRRGALICSFDELMHDVLHNQIIKATAKNLRNSDRISPTLKAELGHLLQQLSHISDVRLSGQIFRRVQLSRERLLYRTLIRLCEFVFQSLLPEEGGSSYQFADVLNDEVRMSAVFEEFLRNFYSHEQSDFRVKREVLKWNALAVSPEDMSLLPNMETDITLLSLQRTVVIDAKYYKETLVGKQGHSKRIRSGHLYQMYAYLHHTTARYPDRQVDGMLIYPTVGQQISADYEIGVHRLKLLTIDLLAPWPEIHDKLLAALSREAAPFSAVV